MTDTRRKALAMFNAAREEHPNPDDYLVAQTALCRAIEQHEATKQELQDFKQKVSDTAQRAIDSPNKTLNVKWALSEFIIPAPKPDPLYECLEEALARNGDDLTEHTGRLRAALEARGLEIRSKNDD